MNVSNTVSFLSMFAGPLGNIFTTGITAGSAAFISYATAKGMDVSTATEIAVAVAGGLAAAINWGGAMIGVQIHVVNTGDNGVKVVRDNRDTAAIPAVSAPVK